MTCSIEGCTKKRKANGLCATHDMRMRRHGDPHTVLRIVHAGTDSERFWKRVRKTEGCWIWEGRTARNGYGTYGLRDKTVIAHRFAYAEVKGPIPDGLQLDHICHNRRCVNPGHLRPVTNKQNNENPSSIRSDNTSGYRGVTLVKSSMLWLAQAQHNGKTYRDPGRFETAEEAAEAARQLRLSLFTHNDADRKQK